MEQPWEEILQEISEAEKRWEHLLKNSAPPVEKPVILLRGKIPIFLLPNVNKTRGGKTNWNKKELEILKHQLTYAKTEEVLVIEKKIKKLKQEVKENKKASKKKWAAQHANKNQ